MAFQITSWLKKKYAPIAGEKRKLSANIMRNQKTTLRYI